MRFILLVFFLLAHFCFSQEQEIIKILNDEIQKEVKYQKNNLEYFPGEKFELVDRFAIKDSILTVNVIQVDSITFEQTAEYLAQTTLQLLSVVVKRKNENNNTYYTEKQEVALNKIKRIIKDINIIFETEPDEVKVITIDENGNKKLITRDLFFLYLSSEKHNEYLAETIIDYFKKAGYDIEKGDWYD
ncbi:hypothetical protein D1632_13890 [Chryseobacterium nematophagum]|uniref:Uncharacterized protein n=1 Tax=Chryseobacterium nematophagum TaxID=2305228 RepID=A0A3M7L7F0_9FLAO|nr:hypothetical protein [Chryseobacterium nematophagum]RMZ58681.1 hypothetical protein D1632_13890 [Chryseobacterium nematophagum]